MEGKLTGIGVGPGDPELLTLKAVRAITESDILILPGRSRDECYAYRIVQKALPEVAEKEFMLADFPMTKNKEELKAAWEKTAEEICADGDAVMSDRMKEELDKIIPLSQIYLNETV